MAKRKRNNSICRWKGCRRSVSKGYLLCDEHLDTPKEPPQLRTWLNELAFALGTGVAASALFEVLRSLVASGHLWNRLPPSLTAKSASEIGPDEYALMADLVATNGGTVYFLPHAVRDAAKDDLAKSS